MTQINFWLQTIISILSGLIVLIPLVEKLIIIMKSWIKEKNWNQMLKLVMKLMADAEEKFQNGNERKDWVKGQLNALSGTLNYDIKWEVVDDMIDTICNVSKQINK